MVLLMIMWFILPVGTSLDKAVKVMGTPGLVVENDRVMYYDRVLYKIFWEKRDIVIMVARAND